MKRSLVFLLAFGAAACARNSVQRTPATAPTAAPTATPAAPPTTAAGTPPATRPPAATPPRTAPAVANAGVPLDSIPLALRWYRASAEVHALFVQSYRNATDAVQTLAVTQAGKPWGVIMDADETVLDNSMYQQSRGGRGYTPETWELWVRSKKATPLPGAADFINRVRALGGKVSIVTNREANVCPETEANLRAIGLNVDQVLCKADASSDKNPRFSAVVGGRTPSKLPAMKVLMWLGDNIQDFPTLGQDVRKGGAAGFAEFGRTWFVLPNPLYGSWDKNSVP